MEVWSPGLTLADVERESILGALRFFRWNKTRTAQALEISVRTIDNKIAKYRKDGVEIPELDEEAKGA